MLDAACTCMRMVGDTACLVLLLVLVLVLVMTDALHGRYQPPAPPSSGRRTAVVGETAALQHDCARCANTPRPPTSLPGATNC